MSCGLGGSCTTQVPPGTTVTLTATASPAARFMGWSGACTGTAPTCQIAPQSDVTVGASFEYELQTLLANDGRTVANSLALNSTSVFVWRYTAIEGSGVWSIPKSGGTPKFVASGMPYFIVADDAYVYWNDGVAIYSAPVEGGTAALLATGAFGNLALDEVGALYWVKKNFFAPYGEVHRMQSRVDTLIASGQESNMAVAVDDKNAYFTSASMDGTDHTIRRVPKKGGTVETVVTTIGAPIFVQVDSRSVYYREGTGSVWSASKDGGAPRLLSALNGSSSSATDVAVSDFTVWWVWSYGLGAMNGIYRSNDDATGFASVDTALNDSNWGGLRVDDAAVYYFHDGALLRRLK
ncbi:MAG TPA: hypothetical protein VG496_02110 [Myxococcales bacterium]|nr:hypothetical protein [Myxococcales bacterium]